MLRPYGRGMSGDCYLGRHAGQPQEGSLVAMLLGTEILVGFLVNNNWHHPGFFVNTHSKVVKAFCF
jgi:hypothetical protein